MVVRIAAVALFLLVPIVAADLQPVLPPTGLEAERQGATVVLTWDAAPEAVQYQVFRDGAAIGLTDDVLFEDLGAPAAAVYWVTAFDVAGHQSPPSAPAALATAPDCAVVSTTTFPYVFVHPEACINAFLKVEFLRL